MYRARRAGVKAESSIPQGKRRVASPTTFMSLPGAQQRSNLSPQHGRLLHYARNDIRGHPLNDFAFALFSSASCGMAGLADNLFVVTSDEVKPAKLPPSVAHTHLAEAPDR
jgi:hypothetical protein